MQKKYLQFRGLHIGFWITLGLLITMATVGGLTLLSKDNFDFEPTQEEQNMVDAINQYRASKDLAPLVPYKKAFLGAQDWVDYLVEKKMLSHQETDGTLQFEERKGKYAYPGGDHEIIGLMEDPTKYENAVALVEKGWVKSPDHIGSLELENAKYIGVGIKEIDSDYIINYYNNSNGVVVYTDKAYLCVVHILIKE